MCRRLRCPVTPRDFMRRRMTATAAATWAGALGSEDGSRRVLQRKVLHAHDFSCTDTNLL